MICWATQGLNTTLIGIVPRRKSLGNPPLVESDESLSHAAPRFVGSDSYVVPLTFTAEQKPERPPPGFVPIGNTQSSTICLGEHLLIHVMSSSIGWHIVRRWELPSETQPGLSQIWPVKFAGVEWPPPSGFIFNDYGVAFLANEFYNRVTNDQRRRAGLL